MTQRYGMTIPFDRVPLGEQRDLVAELVDLGYTDAWSSEADGADAFTPLALASVWAPELRLGTAIIPAFTRGPALLAQSVGSLAQAAPGRFVCGIGASSDVIVERWNDIEFAQPYRRVRDVVRFLRTALEGEKVKQDYDTFSVRGFKLATVPTEPVPILVAALRRGMLELAGREADGAIINWLSAEDVSTVAPIVRQFGPAADGKEPAADGKEPAADGKEKEIVARIFVAPNTDAETVRSFGRFAIAAYLNVPVYARFHEWLGRADQLDAMWTHWREGDRKAALEAIPDELVDQLIVHGSPEACREHIGRYVANGVTTPVLAVLPFPGIDQREAVRSLAPR